jgi:hypothetical protein
MKIDIKNILLVLFALSVPLSASIGQDKKAERRIKVKVDDGSGLKTVIDSTFTNKPLPDSLILKDGKVIYFAGSGKEMIKGDSPEKVFVTVTSTGSDEKNKDQTIIVTSDDKKGTGKAEKYATKHVYAYSTSRSSGEKPETQTIVVTDNDQDINAGANKVIIIKDGKVIKDEDNKDLDVLENLEKNDNDTEMTKYVIAKDGVVVTIESNDEAKAKDLIEEIENKLGVKENDNKETKKTETSNSVKK